MHMLYWIYTKWNELGVSDEMSAEIEVMIFIIKVLTVFSTSK
jgi:hypothetical protein